jgi:hypothetical protein
MSRWGWMALAGLGWACSGDDGTVRPDPEICDDEIDNDGNGLIDCEDSSACGGIHCQQTGDDDDDTAESELVEIVLDDDTCCDFTFGAADCPQKEIGTFSIINRSPDVEGNFDVSCDTVGPNLAPIEWQVAGGSNQVPYLVNLPLAPNATVEIQGYFVCTPGLEVDFTTTCHISAEVEGVKDELDHDVHATVIGGG